MLSFLLSSSAEWNIFSFGTPFETLRTLAIWLTVALVVCFGIGIAVTRGERRTRVISAAAVCAIVCAGGLGVAFLSFEFVENSDSFNALLFAPLCVLIVVSAGCAVALAIKRSKLLYIVCGCLFGAALVATLLCIGVHFASGNAAENNGITNEDVNTPGLYVSAALAVAAVIACAFLCDKGGKGFDTKSISFAAVCVAMSFALSYLRIVKMPQGGSITIASLLPLMIYSFMYGTKKGVFVGMIYGLLQALQDFYLVHPAQFLLDYPVAFAAIGLAGMFAKVKALEKIPQLQFALGAVVAGLARFAVHYLSGVFAFSAFAGDQNPYLYSFIYQAGYVLPDVAITIVAGVLVFSSASFVRFVRAKANSQPA